MPAARAGPFEILEVLGEGSFGTVVVARYADQPAGARYALKILKGTYTKNARIMNRTRDEARVLAQLQHPNIVRVVQMTELYGRPVVVMEHVEGISLDNLLQRFKEGLPVAVALAVARAMYSALDTAYSAEGREEGRPMRVIHRDIKPSNVLLSVAGEVKVVDFGIAKGDFDGREANTESVVMGSRPYMAPERLDGVSDSPAVDVYSTGMSLYELLAGRTMTLSINPVTHERALARQLDRLPLQHLPPETADRLRQFLRAACAYARESRPSHAACVAELDGLLDTLPRGERVDLRTFAQEVVGPIYAAREVTTPEQAVLNYEDEDLFREVTATVTVPVEASLPEPAPAPGWPLSVKLALVAVAGLSVLVFVLLALTLGRVLWDASHPSSLARVRVVLPPGARLEVGTELWQGSGTLNLTQGVQAFRLILVDGQAYSCQVPVFDGYAVTFSPEGRFSYDEQNWTPCAR